MNEVILIGKVSSKYTIKNNNIKLFLEVKSEENEKNRYIPIFFKNVSKDFITSLIGKEIGISGHIEPTFFNRIDVDVLEICND